VEYLDFSNLCECKICNIKKANLNGLSIHLSRIHKLDVETYIVDYVLSYTPLCKCGCCKKVKFNQCKFENYLTGHYTKTKEFNNPWKKSREPENKIDFSREQIELMKKEFIENHKALYQIGEIFQLSKNPIRRILQDELKEEFRKIERFNDSWRRKNIPEINENIRKNASLGAACFSKFYNTKIEKIMKEVLRELNVRDRFTFQYKLKDFKTNRMFNFDFGDKDRKILIECDGDYWHSNPSKFNVLNETQISNKEKDLIKNEVAARNGYKLLRFWEEDILNNLDNIKQQISTITGE
jgi:very-short-patch-repair endonuclease